MAEVVAPPSVLNVMSPGQIQRQAMKTVSSEYRPVLTSIQQEERQATGLADKRDADNQAYQHWLGAQTAALEQQRTTQNTALTGLLSGIQSAQSGLYGGNMSNTLVNQANSRMGNVSDNQNSNVIGTAAANGGQSYTSSMEQSGRGLVDSAIQLAGNNALGSNNLMAASASNDNSVINNNTKVNEADLQNTLTKLRDTLAVDQQRQVGDTNTQYRDLYDRQVALGENNRNFNETVKLARERLANYKSTIAARGNSAKDLNLKTEGYLQNLLNEEQNRSANATNSTGRTNAYVQNVLDEIQNRNKTYAAKYGLGPVGSGGQLLSQSGQNTAHAKIEAYAGLANSILQDGYMQVGGKFVKITPQNMRTLWQNGGKYYIANNATQKYEMKTLSSAPAGKSDPLWWSGFQTSNAGKGLTKWDIQALASYGIRNDGLPVAKGKK